ncbi:MAG: prenyltransferase [Candidatus Calescibacterium sp.]|nr:prenyltransferase [Candidatus Calescibacterium sp.]MCX7972492.1 prenyltransferase [bacterium]MDW8195616.1 prenyltransferase [Candidatus Calescibacterium sp.]
MNLNFSISRIKDYFLALRPHIIIMSVPCWFIGVSLAIDKGYFNLTNAILTLIGALFLHLSVNAFNEVFDYLRGNDSIESVSEYSGGGGYLVRGIISPFEMGTFAIILFLLGCSIGIYLSFQHKILLLIGLIGSIMILLYTPIFKTVGLGEIAMIFGFSMISLGTYICMFEPNKYIFNLNTFLLLFIPGLWKSTVLVINEFPDYENDKKAQVKNWIVRFGRKNTSYIYLFMMIIFYSTIAYLFVNGFLNIFSLISLLTIPLSLKIFWSSLNYVNLEKHIPVMKSQVNLGYFSLFTIGISLIFA